MQHLIQERWLEVRPGIGTFVAPPPEARAGDRAKLVGEAVEQLVVDAMRLGLSRQELMDAIEAGWIRLDGAGGGR